MLFSVCHQGAFTALATKVAQNVTCTAAARVGALPDSKAIMPRDMAHVVLRAEQTSCRVAPSVKWLNWLG